MASKAPRKPRTKAQSPPEEVINLAGPAQVDDLNKLPRRGRPMASNNSNNNIAKSRLSLIIDMLNVDDMDDDKTLKKNVLIAVKHLKEVENML